MWKNCEHTEDLTKLIQEYWGLGILHGCARDIFDCLKHESILGRTAMSAIFVLIKIIIVIVL